jgi:putative hydrolase of HD superfamily
MKEIINFLIEVGKLKKMKRRGWVLRGVKNPETIAAHTFRVAIMGWVLGKQKRLNVNKILKISLIHDLCEVYAGDTTPYDELLPKERKKWKKLFEKWPRFSKETKEKIFLKKYKKENEALKKLLSSLSPALKKEIRNLWLDYEKGLSSEGRFIRQLDRVENLLQAIEYLEEGEQFPLAPWWIQMEELVDDPLLLDFTNRLDKQFYLKKEDGLIDFFIKIGKLKKKKRECWLIHQIKEPETIAEHTFRTAIIAWLLGERKKLNSEKVIKMALIHDLGRVYAPDLTPYDPLLSKGQKEIKVLKRWSKFKPALKNKKYKKQYKLESSSLNKLLSRLPLNIRSEIKRLWLDFKKGLTKEGRFVNQVDKVESFLQGMEYWKKCGKIKYRLWLGWIREIVDDPVLFEFIKTLEKKILSKKN